MKLYDLIDQPGGINFSSFGWRVRLALKHKGLTFDKVDLTFTEIQTQIPEASKGKWKLTPLVVDDDGEIMGDSFDIAQRLDEKYIQSPLFPNGQNYAKFLDNYLQIHFSKLFNLNVLTIYDHLNDQDKTYFKNLRETQFKKSLKEISELGSEIYPHIHKALKPIIKVLSESTYLEGKQVTYSDYLGFGTLQWVKLLNPIHFENILNVEGVESKVLNMWFNSIADLFDGYGNDSLVYHS